MTLLILKIMWKRYCYGNDFAILKELWIQCAARFSGAHHYKGKVTKYFQFRTPTKSSPSLDDFPW